jgi:hypothetical protein
MLFMMLQMSDVREGGRFLGVGGFWVVGLSAKEQTRRLPTAAIQRLVGRLLNHTSLSVPCGSP